MLVVYLPNQSLGVLCNEIEKDRMLWYSVDQKEVEHRRSSSMLLLIEPKSRHSWGDRSISSAAPRIWNSLPLNLRYCLCTTKFKSLLLLLLLLLLL